MHVVGFGSEQRGIGVGKKHPRVHARMPDPAAAPPAGAAPAASVTVRFFETPSGSTFSASPVALRAPLSAESGAGFHAEAAASRAELQRGRPDRAVVDLGRFGLAARSVPGEDEPDGRPYIGGPGNGGPAGQSAPLRPDVARRRFALHARDRRPDLPQFEK